MNHSSTSSIFCIKSTPPPLFFSFHRTYFTTGGDKKTKYSSTKHDVPISFTRVSSFLPQNLPSKTPWLQSVQGLFHFLRIQHSVSRRHSFHQYHFHHLSESDKFKPCLFSRQSENKPACSSPVSTRHDHHH